MNRTYVAALASAILTIAVGIYQYTRLGSVVPLQLQFHVFAPGGAPAADAAVAP